MRILFVLSSDGRTEDTGTRMARFLAAYYICRDAGMEVVLASPEGGYPWASRFRPVGNISAIEARFLDDAAARDDLANTLSLAQIFADDFAAVYFVGAQVSLRLGRAGNALDALIVEFLEAGKPVALTPSGLDILRNGVGGGLLMVGDSQAAAARAARALIAALQ